MRHMRASSALALSLLTALAAGCATGPATRTDQDPSVDLRDYHTFGFYDDLDTDRAKYATILSGRLKVATRQELERLDYAYSENDPDLRVNFILDVEEKQELRAPVTGSRLRPAAFTAWGGHLYDVGTVDRLEATLSIDLVDAKSRSLVWRGVAEGRLGQDALEHPGPAIDGTVREIFARFPAEPAE